MIRRMKNDDEFLKQQAQLLAELSKAGADFCYALGERVPEEASTALAKIFSTVDAMRASARPATAYFSAMGEGVLVEGIIE